VKSANHAARTATIVWRPDGGCDRLDSMSQLTLEDAAQLAGSGQLRKEAAGDEAALRACKETTVSMYSIKVGGLSLLIHLVQTASTLFHVTKCRSRLQCKEL
jgi:hypothetical protein